MWTFSGADLWERAMMLPSATVEHVLTGRLRVRVPGLRGNHSFFRSAIETLSQHPEISAVIVNPSTGSILIEHTTDPESLGEFAVERGLFEVSRVPSTPAGRMITSSPKIATSGLVVLGVVQAARGEVLGPATENFWNAYGSLRVLHNLPLMLLFGGLGLFQISRGRAFGSAASLLFYAFMLERLMAPYANARPAETLPRLPSK
jgi:Heavy metal associated domain 2